MHKCVTLGAIVLLASCGSDRAPSIDNIGTASHSTADADTIVASATAAPMSLLNTTWEFDDDGKPTVITIDKSGDYIENRIAGTHVVHGIYVQKDGKDCFTSAMGDKATSCWTTVPEVEIGATASATSDSGTRAVFKRVNYRELKIPG